MTDASTYCLAPVAMLVTLTPTAKHRGEEAVVMRIGFAALILVLGLLVARQFLAPPPPAPVTSAAIIAPSLETQPALMAPPVRVTAAAAVAPLPDTDTAQPQKVVRGMAETAGEEALAPPVSEAVLACQQIWHPSTHMSREEWAQSCRRVESNAETAETEATTATGEVAARRRDQASHW